MKTTKYKILVFLYKQDRYVLSDEIIEKFFSDTEFAINTIRYLRDENLIYEYNRHEEDEYGTSTIDEYFYRISITGIEFVENRRNERYRFVIPLIVSIIALVLSVFSYVI